MRFLKLLLFVLMAVTEDFSGSAAALANPPWTQQRSADTVNKNGSGVGIGSVNAKDLFAFWNADPIGADQYSQLTIAGGLASGTQFVQPIVRASGTGDTSFNHYLFYTDGASGATHSELAKNINGAATVLANYATTFTTGDVVRLEVRANRLYVYKNGILLAPSTGGLFVTDSSHVSGAPGIGVFGNIVTIDNWVGDGLPDMAAVAPLVAKPLTLLRCRPLGCGNPLREVKYYDVPSAATGISDTVAESLSSAETEDVAVDFVATDSESLAAADSETAIATFPVSEAESLAASDSQSATETVSGSVVESLAASASQIGGLAVASAEAETLTATDAQTGIIALSAARTETLTAADTETTVLGAQGLHSETLSASDTESSLLTALGVYSDSLAAADALIASVISAAIVSDALSASDSITGVISSLASFTFRFQGGPVMTATISAGGVLTASITGGPVLTSSVSGGPA